jgi:hypothetical protein
MMELLRFIDMDIPTYIQDPNQENYNEELNQTLRDGLSDNGWTTPQISAANLAIIAPQMPDGTQWYVTDAVPPGPVMNVAGVIKRLATAAYP